MKERIEDLFVSQIQYNYVSTNDNPSDLVTRGISFREFYSKLEFWTHGPRWLTLDKVDWPKFELKCLSDAHKDQILTAVSFNDSNVIPILDVSRYSNINKLFRISGYVFKFIFKLKHRTNATVEDAVRLYWLSIMQLQSFPEENKFLEEDNNNSNVPKLVMDLDLFLDKVRLIRSKGRIAKTNYYDYNVINPILLGKNHPLTRLIILNCHKNCKHLGIQTTLNLL